MNWVKVVFYNLGITFALLGAVLMAPPLIENSSDFISSQFFKETDGRANLSIYDKFDWSDRYYAEKRGLSSSYHDYISWRRNDYAGETINIVDGIRRSSNTDAVQGEPAQDGREYWFFGGSTTWGTGVNDDNTYPSVFARRNRAQVKNFGESGYIARQSLSLLQNQYITRQAPVSNVKRVVVFYDGVNDVMHRCRNEIEGLGTGREAQIQLVLLGGNWSFYRTFSQLSNYLDKTSKKIANLFGAQDVSFYDCVSDPARARFIAETLVSTWRQARSAAQANGDEFIAILQPVAYIGSADVTYLNLHNATGKQVARQYEIVYPLIVDAAKASDIPFIDLTDAYDGCADCYIDFCHVGPQAHQLLVERMTREIARIRSAPASQ